MEKRKTLEEMLTPPKVESKELETGEIDPEVEKELRSVGLTDYYFQVRKANILAVKEMSKYPISYEEAAAQMQQHSKRD